MTYPLTVEVLSMGGEWRVQVDGAHHSRHYLKRRALAEAKRVAKDHAGSATLRIQGADGQWQRTRHY